LDAFQKKFHTTRLLPEDIFWGSMIINALDAIWQVGFEQDKNLQVLCQYLGECDTWVPGFLLDMIEGCVP